MALVSTLKTTGLMATLTALVVFIGFVLTGSPNGALLFLLLAGVMNFATYLWSDRIVLRTHGVKLVEPDESPELHSIIDALSRDAGMPRPKVGIYESRNPNAFATGRSPEHATVAVSTSLLSIMDREELEGIIAHELSHVRNRDTLISTVASVMAGAISWMAWSMLWGRDNKNPAATLLVFVLAPLAATIIQLAISRTREYRADASAARLTRNPDGLASALRKLEGSVSRRPAKGGNQSFENLYIVNPFKNGLLNRLFSTHPTVEERVERLAQLRVYP